MGIFLIYILKSAVCLSLFYLFYRLLLSKETFHRFNRIALLGILFLSLLIPFIEVTTAHQTELSQTVLTVEQLLMMAEAMDPAEVSVAQPEELSISWVQVLLLFYLVGIIFFACRNLYSLSRLLLLIKSGKRERLKGGVRLIVLEREVAPFSWMKYVVISEKDLQENGKEILIHESGSAAEHMRDIRRHARKIRQSKDDPAEHDQNQTVNMPDECRTFVQCPQQP